MLFESMSTTDGGIRRRQCSTNLRNSGTVPLYVRTVSTCHKLFCNTAARVDCTGSVPVTVRQWHKRIDYVIWSNVSEVSKRKYLTNFFPQLCKALHSSRTKCEIIALCFASGKCLGGSQEERMFAGENLLHWRDQPSISWRWKYIRSNHKIHEWVVIYTGMLNMPFYGCQRTCCDTVVKTV